MQVEASSPVEFRRPDRCRSNGCIIQPGARLIVAKGGSAPVATCLLADRGGAALKEGGPCPLPGKQGQASGQWVVARGPTEPLAMSGAAAAIHADLHARPTVQHDAKSAGLKCSAAGPGGAGSATAAPPGNPRAAEQADGGRCNLESNCNAGSSSNNSSSINNGSSSSSSGGGGGGGNIASNAGAAAAPSNGCCGVEFGSNTNNASSGSHADNSNGGGNATSSNGGSSVNNNSSSSSSTDPVAAVPSDRASGGGGCCGAESSSNGNNLAGASPSNRTSATPPSDVVSSSSINDAGSVSTNNNSNYHSSPSALAPSIRCEGGAGAAPAPHAAHRASPDAPSDRVADGGTSGSTHNSAGPAAAARAGPGPAALAAREGDPAASESSTAHQPAPPTGSTTAPAVLDARDPAGSTAATPTGSTTAPAVLDARAPAGSTAATPTVSAAAPAVLDARDPAGSTAHHPATPTGSTTAPAVLDARAPAGSTAATLTVSAAPAVLDARDPAGSTAHHLATPTGSTTAPAVLDARAPAGGVAHQPATPTVSAAAPAVLDARAPASTARPATQNATGGSDRHRAAGTEEGVAPLAGTPGTRRPANAASSHAAAGPSAGRPNSPEMLGATDSPASSSCSPEKPGATDSLAISPTSPEKLGAADSPASSPCSPEKLGATDSPAISPSIPENPANSPKKLDSLAISPTSPENPADSPKKLDATDPPASSPSSPKQLGVPARPKPSAESKSAGRIPADFGPWEHLCTVDPDEQSEAFPNGVISLMPARGEDDGMFLDLGSRVDISGCNLCSDTGHLQLNIGSQQHRIELRSGQTFEPRVEILGETHQAMLFAAVIDRTAGKVSRLSFGTWPVDVKRDRDVVMLGESEGRLAILKQWEVITEKLAYLYAQGSIPAPWIPDSRSDCCLGCSAAFKLFRRRHHCRSCGMLYCSRCCSSVRYLPFGASSPQAQAAAAQRPWGSPTLNSTLNSNASLSSTSSGKPTRVCDACALLCDGFSDRRVDSPAPVTPTSVASRD